MMRFSDIPRVLAALIIAVSVTGCDNHKHSDHGTADHGTAEAEFERGPHHGRMLRAGDFAAEITVFETGTPPIFRVYPYWKDKPADPQKVDLTMQVKRLGGKTDHFRFAAREDHLDATTTVTEPHSFDVTVRARYGDIRHSWQYASYEGRTEIPAGAAKAAGVKIEKAGPAVLEKTIDLSGRTELQPDGKAEVRARYPGHIVAMMKTIGDKVRRGEVLARIEASESLQTYALTAPLSGIVIARNANVGDVTGDTPVFVLADPTKLHAELFIYPRDAELIHAGQKVEIQSVSGKRTLISHIETIPPVAHPNTQTLIAHVAIPPDAEGWRPGMGVEGHVVVATRKVPLAVRTKALQRFRDFTVVYARYGNTYEVRMLDLGQRTPEWTEVLGGLDPGTPYVADNAFLIRADVEKDGASHDH